MESTLSFDGRVYDGVGYRFERPWRELRIGRRVGTGEVPVCSSDDPARRVRVFSVVGCGVRDVVLLRSEGTVMVRESLVPRVLEAGSVAAICGADRDLEGLSRPARAP